MELTKEQAEIVKKLLTVINVATLKAVAPLATWDEIIEKLGQV